MIRYRGRFVREWYWPSGSILGQLHPVAAMHIDGRQLLLQLAPLAVAHRPPRVTVTANGYRKPPGGGDFDVLAGVQFGGEVTLEAAHLGDVRYAVALSPTDARWVEPLGVSIFPEHAPRRVVDWPKPCPRCGCRVFEWTERWDDEGNEWEETWCKRCEMAKG
jgi:hypothetical protein